MFAENVFWELELAHRFSITAFSSDFRLKIEKLQITFYTVTSSLSKQSTVQFGYCPLYQMGVITVCKWNNKVEIVGAENDNK